MNTYDVIVIGGGHAGVEAAWFASRMGASTALITMQREAIGRMSCNPAIGGLGKGHIVREIDALGGIMGLATDRAGIQFRMLNRRKGPAVWAPRAQADRDAYPKTVQELLCRSSLLDIIEGTVDSIGTTELKRSSEPRASARAVFPKDERIKHSDNRYTKKKFASADESALKRVTGVQLADGRRLKADAIIITTGTFLRAVMHCGQKQSEGGRVGEGSAKTMSATLLSLGFELGRLKTGTPPRIHRDSINYDVCEVQPGDDPPIPLSSMTDAITQPQINCWVTWTNERVHEQIRSNLHRAPMYSGQIESRGPRYCPSIEDKVVRFAEKNRHQIFLEPEGYDNERVYCNGISTSLPAEVQEDMVHEVPGLENAKILQHGYAVEYDFVPTHQTKVSLESKLVAGLFLAGQINGTSGYEEAAGQGLIAGINAVQYLRGEQPIVLSRDQAYIGVMIDDLVTKPPVEPYRMFTSRAEYRLLLRADNADQRLAPLGRRLGTVCDRRWERFERKQRAINRIKALCDQRQVRGVPLSTWMRRPDADMDTFSDALSVNGHGPFGVDDLWQVLTDAKYSGYVQRQDRQVEQLRKLDGFRIPEGLDFQSIRELRAEAREQLHRVGPQTLGQAGRITGINPSDITILWVHLTNRRRKATHT